MDLARLGSGQVSPNPLVGCVLVANGKIIGEGYHRKFGEAHAEVNAIASVADQALLKGAAAYVNLEPCSHQGKTPPCADKLVQVGVSRVVIANKDINPLVAGNGIDKLKASGLDVVVGVLEQEGRFLNRRFFTLLEQGIPYVILKWAESEDGFFAPEEENKLWISNAHSRQRVHQWRAEEDAVLVGTETAEVDNPQLNVRDWSGRNPLRVVIDRSLRLSRGLHLFDQTRPTLCYNLLKDEQMPNVQYVKLPEKKFLTSLLKDLADRNIGSLIVEGGAKTLELFIQEGLWHEARVFRSDKSLERGKTAPLLRGRVLSEDQLTGDSLTVYINQARIRT